MEEQVKNEEVNQEEVKVEVKKKKFFTKKKLAIGGAILGVLATIGLVVLTSDKDSSKVDLIPESTGSESETESNDNVKTTEF